MAALKRLCMCLILVQFLSYGYCFKAFMRFVDEFTHCALPNDLKDPGECHKCIGDCTIYGITPRGPDVDVGRAAGQDYPTCEACRIKCALLKPDECSHVSGYGAGIACTDWGGVGYCS